MTVFYTIFLTIFIVLFILALIKIINDQKKLSELKSLNSELESKLEQSRDKLIRSEVMLEGLNKTLKEKESAFEKMEVIIKERFELIAKNIIEDSSGKLKNKNNESMDTLIKPLKERISGFEEKIERWQDSQVKRHASLYEQIKIIRELGLQMNKDASNLTNALKTDSKTQGNWGELILERILESSGLEKDREYIIQADSSNSDDGSIKKLRPDVIIKLPDDKHLIIDAKVSLKAFEGYINSEDEGEQKASLNLHIKSVKSHIKTLHEKYYHRASKINSPDFVLLFMPMEAAFSLAIKHDNAIFEYAWENKIVIVSPSTLLATLKTVASIWKYEYQNNNTREIARIAGLMYDQLSSYHDTMEKVGVQIKRTEEHWESAFKKLISGKQSVYNRAHKLKSLGISTRKELPEKDGNE